MAKVTFKGVTIHYRSIGEGRDVVLIHGLGTNLGFWNPSILIPMARRYRVTVFDLRGHGYSGMPERGYKSADMAEDLSDLLTHLDVHRADLIGHSFGGVVALHCAVLVPEKVNSLILADTRVRAFQPSQSPREWMIGENLVKSLAELGFVFPEDEKEAGVWLLEKLHSLEWREKRRELQGNRLFTPFGGLRGSRRMADRWLQLLATTSAREDFTTLAGLTRERLQAIRQPLLALFCENSTAMRSLDGMKESLPHCETAVIPAAGHFFPITHPEAFLSNVNRFLAQVKPGERREKKRVLLHLPLIIRATNRTFLRAATVNVSPRGLLMEGAVDLEVGSVLEIKAQVSRSEGEIAMMGKVVRMIADEGGYPYRFGVALSPGSNGLKAWEEFFYDHGNLLSEKPNLNQGDLSRG